MSCRSNYLIPKTIAQRYKQGNAILPAQFKVNPAIEYVYTSITNPKASAHSSANLNKDTVAPDNPTNNAESLVRS